MQRIFNMLIQNLTSMGNSITQVNFYSDFINVEFADGKQKYVVTIRVEKEEQKDA